MSKFPPHHSALQQAMSSLHQDPSKAGQLALITIMLVLEVRKSRADRQTGPGIPLSRQRRSKEEDPAMFLCSFMEPS